MTTINPAFTHAQFEGDLGFSYVFAIMDILTELQDQLNVHGLGVVPLKGDVAQTGSDVLRVTHMGSVGWSRRFAALANEDSPVTPSPMTTGYSEITVGYYGLGHEATYFSQALGRQEAVSLDDLKALVPASWLSTFRYLVAVAASGFATSVGSTTLALSADDWLDLCAASRTLFGPITFAMLDPAQVTQLLESFRNEPAFQANIAEFAELQAANRGQEIPNFARLGIDIGMSDDVQQSGGAYQGGAWSPGGIGWGRSRVTPIQTANPAGTMYFDEFGLLIEEITTGGENGKRAYNARSILGVDIGDSSVFAQRLVRSVV